MQKILAGVIGAAALVAGVTGCNNAGTFDYSSAHGTLIKLQEKGIAQKSIAVLPFLDQRGSKYFEYGQYAQAYMHPAGDHGSFYLGFIPLYPFGYVEKEEPENSEDFVSLGRYQFNPSQDLADAAVQSLKASNLFSEVHKVNRPDQAHSDFLWRGKVTHTCYRGRMYSYFISYFFAWPLWIVGAPNGSSENELAVDFELVERKSGRVVWNYNFSGADYLNHWIYARIGKDASLYAQLMKQAMNGALYDLNRKFSGLNQ